MKWYRCPKMLQRGALALLGAFVAVPLGWVLLCSFENPVPYVAENFRVFLHRYISLRQYGNVLFHDPEYWASYWNTIWLTIPSLALAVAVASLAAYGLRVMDRRRLNGILSAYGILSLLPMQMLLVPQLIMLSNLHLRGTRLAVVLIGGFAPWYVFFLYRLCRHVPDEVFETAQIEGAGEWTVFRKIALPQMRLGILIFMIIVSADLWGMVEEPLVYIQNVEKYPLSVLFMEERAGGSYAGVVVFSLPVVLLFFDGIHKLLEREGTQG